jgi:hypothetical protein
MAAGDRVSSARSSRRLAPSPGFPDIIRIIQGCVYALGSPKGRLTDLQRLVHERLREAGANVAIAHGIDQALAHLEAWNLLRHDVAKARAPPRSHRHRHHWRDTRKKGASNE